MRRRFRKADWIFLAVTVCLIAALLFFFSFFRGEAGGSVVVTVDRTVYGTYPLSEDAVISIDTEDGHNVLTIRGGEAKMTEADCPDRLCVHQKADSRSRETIVCLPHKVVVSVESRKESGLDAVAE